MCSWIVGWNVCGCGRGQCLWGWLAVLTVGWCLLCVCVVYVSAWDAYPVLIVVCQCSECCAPKVCPSTT